MPSLTAPRRRARRAAVLLALAASAAATVLVAAGPLTGGDGTEASTAEFRSEPAAPAPSAEGGDRRAPDEARAGRDLSGAPSRGESGDGPWPKVEWRDSVAVGLPTSGELVRAVQVPAEGRHFFTWDPVQRESPNRPWRRFGTDHAVRATLEALADHRRAFPRAPRLGIGDVSRPRGGDFGTDYGPIGHASHQNGLDVDVYYPLQDGTERAPLSVDEIDLKLSQDLVDRFVAAGAEKVFVGPSTGLTGPPEVVLAIPNHDNHLHARFPAEG